MNARLQQSAWCTDPSPDPTMSLSRPGTLNRGLTGEGLAFAGVGGAVDGEYRMGQRRRREKPLSLSPGGESCMMEVAVSAV